jgi:adenine-specific DNA-methyltransferase
MVDESLKQYFKTHIQIDDIDNKLNILFSSEDQSNPFNTELSKKLVNLIDSLRVVDPAVGSGAFPMRILNRLVFLLHKLDPDNSLWKQSQIDGIKKSVKDPTLQRKFIEDTERKFKEKNPDYGRKLYLIEKCIYGVDIQQIAVEIAKLRFFISLLVDEKVENGEIEPLPNLDFKLMQGNSLISSFAGIDFTNKPQNDDNLFDFDEKYKQLIEEFEELKSQYQNEPDVKNKNTLRQKIDTKLLEIFEEKLKQHYPQLKNLESKYSGREEIIEAEKKKLFKKIGVDVEQAEQDLIAYTEGRKQKDFFLWDVYFAEVFADAKGFDVVIGNPPYGVKYTPSEKQLLRKIYPESQFKIDSYSLFLLKSFDLLRQDGFCSYIISNTLLDNYFEEKVRELILQNASIKEINDLDDKVFETGVVHTMIFSFLKVIQTSNSIKCNYSNNLSAGFFQIPQDYFLNQEKFTFNIREYGNKDLISKIKKETIPLNTVLDMRQTIKTGNDDIYILSKPRKKSHKPILRGKDIFKYHYKPPSLYVNYGSHLACPRNHKIFEQPKILIREAGSTITATYDEDNYYIMSSLYNGILINKNYSLKFLLGIINSRLFQFLMHKMIFEKTKGAFTKAKIYHYEKLPIKISSESIQKPIIELVEKIIQKKQKNPDANTQSTEDQIDIMVYKLYNLTYEEVEIIDPQIGSIISKGDYEKFEI